MEIYSVVCHQSCSLTLLEQQWADCQQLLEARRTSFTKASSDLHSSLHYLMLLLRMLFCCHPVNSLSCLCVFSAHVRWLKPNCGLPCGIINISWRILLVHLRLSHKERKEYGSVRRMCFKANPPGMLLSASLQPLLAPTAQPLSLGKLWQSASCLWYFIDRTRLPGHTRYA